MTMSTHETSTFEAGTLDRRTFVRAMLAAGVLTVGGAGLAGCANTAAEDDSAGDSADISAVGSDDATTGTAAQATVYPLTFKMYDGDGLEFSQTFEKAPERAVTLTDSGAEIMCRIGLAGKVVGIVSPEAKTPEDIKADFDTLPVLGDKMTLSNEIIVGIDPDVIIGRPFVFTSARQATAAEFNPMGINLYSAYAATEQVNPTMMTIVEDVRNLAALFDVSEQAVDYIDGLEAEITEVEQRIAALDTSKKQRVLVMALFNEGTFATFGAANSALQINLLNSLGGELVTSAPGQGLTYENLIEYDPDVIIYITADRNAQYDAVALETLYGEPSLAAVPAIADKRIAEIPYAEFMDVSPNIITTAEKLIGVLHP
jgi:iron complex transport system substrate-binding protein